MRYWIRGAESGVGLAGLAPAFVTFRNANTGAAATVAAPAIVKVSDANAPGLFYFDYSAAEVVYVVVDMDPGGVGPLAGTERYLWMLVEPRDASLDTISPHCRLKTPVFNAAGRLVSAELVYYATAEDAEDDDDPISTVAVTATYGADGRLASYLTQGE